MCVWYGMVYGTVISTRRPFGATPRVEQSTYVRTEYKQRGNSSYQNSSRSFPDDTRALFVDWERKSLL